MAKYGNVVYHGATYGETPKIAYSVAPMSVQVIDFHVAYVYWQPPNGNFSKFRLIRNQNGFPETAEDGYVVFEQSSADGSNISGQVTRNYFFDGEENLGQVGIESGRQVYYSVFLFTNAKIWVKAGSTTGVVPKDTGATEKLLNLLPRVLTSEQISPLGTVSPDSAIYKFLDGFAFTYEEWLTDLELIRPTHGVDKASYSTIPGEDLNVGLSIEPNIPAINQRRLIREAFYMYSHRGLKLGIEDYAESLTGYPPVATVSPNLLLTVQDSTFYNSVGNWVATGATIEPATNIVPATTSNQIDTTYTCKITAASSGSMILGASSPITKGIPVNASTQYTFGCYLKSPSSAGTITISVQFFDKDGNSTSSYHSGTATAANNTWKTTSVTATTDATSSYAILKISYSAAGTYYVDQVSAQLGDTVTYDEARAITLLLNPKKENYIKNPSFEVDASTWTVTGATFSQESDVPTDGYSGTYSGKFVAAGDWSIKTVDKIPVDPGSYITASMYSKSTDMTSMNMSLDVYDLNDTLLFSFTDTHSIMTTWMRNSISGLIPSDSTASYAELKFSGTAGTLYLDSIQAEDTYEATDYFDGSMPEQFGAVWAGTPHASSTLLYPSKLVKIPRLAGTLNDWVPMNAWWRIITPAKEEYNNLTV
jgi:hypothetical protein